MGDVFIPLDLPLPTLQAASIIQPALDKTTLKPSIKQKITAHTAIFVGKNTVNSRSGRFNNCANALGAQHLTHLLTILINRNGLKVWSEGTRGRFLRPRAVASKSGFLTAMCTLSHNYTSLLDNIYTGNSQTYDKFNSANARVLLPWLTAVQSYHKTAPLSSYI